LELPFQSTDFDFETVKEFGETSAKGKKEDAAEATRPRLGSEETIVTGVESKKASSPRGIIDYRMLRNQMGINTGGAQNQSCDNGNNES